MENRQTKSWYCQISYSCGNFPISGEQRAQLKCKLKYDVGVFHPHVSVNQRIFNCLIGNWRLLRIYSFGKKIPLLSSSIHWFILWKNGYSPYWICIENRNHRNSENGKFWLCYVLMKLTKNLFRLDIIK